MNQDTNLKKSSVKTPDVSKLNRRELLEIMLAQSKEIDNLRARLELGIPSVGEGTTLGTVSTSVSPELISRMANMTGDINRRIEDLEGEIGKLADTIKAKPAIGVSYPAGKQDSLISQLNAEHAIEIEKLKAEFARSEAELKVKYENEMTEIKVKLEERIKELEEELNNYDLKSKEVGSLAEASLQVTKIFEEAEKSAVIYLENIMKRYE